MLKGGFINARFNRSFLQGKRGDDFFGDEFAERRHYTDVELGVMGWGPLVLWNPNGITEIADNVE